MPEPLATALGWLPHELALLVETLLKVVALLVPLLVTVAWYTYAERKVIGYMQVRLGPNRVGPKGWLQPIADAVKLLFKEFIIPAGANRVLFVAAPVISLASALAAWAVVPFSDFLVVADINAGLLYILAMTSLGVYGVIIAGWSSNSKYALLGAMRSAAQIVAYEIAMGFALVVVLMAAGSLNLREIVLAQEGGWVHWFWLPLLPMFVVYVISGVAETNRAPFDVAEGESEIVAGFHVEYSGIAFTVFFMAEYANMVLISALTVIIPRRLAVAVPRPRGSGLDRLDLRPRGPLVRRQARLLHVPLPVAARDLSPVPLRPDHAARVEGLHPADDRLDRGGGSRDHGGPAAVVRRGLRPAGTRSAPARGGRGIRGRQARYRRVRS